MLQSSHHPYFINQTLLSFILLFHEFFIESLYRKTLLGRLLNSYINLCKRSLADHFNSLIILMKVSEDGSINKGLFPLFKYIFFLCVNFNLFHVRGDSKSKNSWVYSFKNKTSIWYLFPTDLRLCKR